MDPVQPRFTGFLLLIMAHGATILASGPPVTQLTPNPLPSAPWTDIAEFAVDGAASRVVYEADPSADGAYQILSVPILGGTIAEISHGAATGIIDGFAITGDGLRVVYKAGANYELHSSLIEGGDNQLLSGATWNISYWVLSPDGSMVMFIATAVVPPFPPGGRYLFAVPTAGGSLPEYIAGQHQPLDPVMTGPLLASPGGQWVAYKEYLPSGESRWTATTWDGSSQDVVGSSLQNYTFPQFTADDNWIVVNNHSSGFRSKNLVTGVGYWAPTQWQGGPWITPVPVGGRYRLVLLTEGCPFDLYMRPIDFNAPGLTLMDGFCGGLKVAISSDGGRVVRSDPTGLFSVPTLGGMVQQLNGPDGQVSEFLIAPDGQRVLYAADELQPGNVELFVVDIDGGTPLKISTDLPPWGNVDGFRISSDGETVVYRADIAQDSSFQLFSVPLTGGQSLEIGSDIRTPSPRTVRDDMVVTSDDGHVVYRTGFVDVTDPPAEVLFSVVLDTDADGDDVLDSVDCDGGDAGVWALPGEVTGLTLARQEDVPEVTVLNWTPPDDPGGQTLRYDVLRTDSAAAYMTSGPIDCVATAVSDPEAQDAEVPEAVYFYLARAVNDCGNGGGGVDREAADGHVCE